MLYSPSMIYRFIDLIFPPKCIICREKVSTKENNYPYLCNNCFRNIIQMSPPFCKKCGRHISFAVHNLLDCTCIECENKRCYFDNIWTICRYESVIRECLHKFKYSKKVFLSKLLGQLSCEFIEQYVDIKKFDIIIPVPIHKQRLKERGFNQAELLSTYISKKFRINTIKNNLVRIKYLVTQTSLNRTQRIKNIKNNFKIIKPAVFKDKNILLVDDVFTTGSTVNECARIIKKCGAYKVGVLTIARGM